MENKINVDIFFDNSEKQCLYHINIDDSASIKDAIYASSLLSDFPTIDLMSLGIGIFSEKASLTTELHGGERIELYRDLKICPKEARLLRAKKKVK